MTTARPHPSRARLGGRSQRRRLVLRAWEALECANPGLNSVPVCSNMTLMNAAAAKRRIRRRARELNRIVHQHPRVDPQVVWQTLVLLEQPPLERLLGGLRRGQVFNFR